MQPHAAYVRCDRACPPLVFTAFLPQRGCPAFAGLAFASAEHGALLSKPSPGASQTTAGPGRDRLPASRLWHWERHASYLTPSALQRYLKAERVNLVLKALLSGQPLPGKNPQPKLVAPFPG